MAGFRKSGTSSVTTLDSCIGMAAIGLRFTAALIEKTPAGFSAFADSDDSKPVTFLADCPTRLWTAIWKAATFSVSAKSLVPYRHWKASLTLESEPHVCIVAFFGQVALGSTAANRAIHSLRIVCAGNTGFAPSIRGPQKLRKSQDPSRHLSFQIHFNSPNNGNRGIIKSAPNVRHNLLSDMGHLG